MFANPTISMSKSYPRPSSSQAAGHGADGHYALPFCSETFAGNLLKQFESNQYSSLCLPWADKSSFTATKSYQGGFCQFLALEAPRESFSRLKLPIIAHSKYYSKYFILNGFWDPSPCECCPYLPSPWRCSGPVYSWDLVCYYACLLSLWRVVQGSKLMHLDLIHGLFIT